MMSVARLLCSGAILFSSSMLGCFDLEGVPDPAPSNMSSDPASNPNGPEDTDDQPGDDGSGGSGNDEEPMDDNDVPPDGGSFQLVATNEGRVALADSSGLVIDPETLAVEGIVPMNPTTALPDGFESAPYYGAVDPDAVHGEAWWQEWTVIDARFDGNLPGEDFHPLRAEIEGGLLVPSTSNQCAVLNADFKDGGEATVFGIVFPVCIVDQRIESDTTLSNDHVFVLRGSVNVGSGDLRGFVNNDVGAIVTIERGTQIYGALNTEAILVASRGSRIQANGTRELPIVMGAVSLNDDGTAVSAADDLSDLSGRGQWGGLVLSGNAPNNRGTDIPSESSPADSTRWYGGTNDEDSSGQLNYVIIAEAGLALLPDEDIQGLTLESTGSGTALDYIQVVGADDDCVEWLGGSSRMEHLVCVGVADDGIDIDAGYRGRVQFAIVRLGSANGEFGIESDNSGGDFLDEPVSSPDIANVLVLGAPGRPNASSVGALHREGFAGRVHRSVFTDDIIAGRAFDSGCLDVDDVLADGLAHFDSVFNCSGGDSDGLSPPDD